MKKRFDTVQYQRKIRSQLSKEYLKSRLDFFNKLKQNKAHRGSSKTLIHN